jgi:hypothetical protein
VALGGKGGIDIFLFNLSIRRGWSCQQYAPPRGKYLRYPLYRKLGDPHPAASASVGDPTPVVQFVFRHYND